MFGRPLESLSQRRKSKIIKWSMLTNYRWQMISCLSVSPTLLSFPDRVGPNSRWCRREAWTWDIQISGSLTSTPGKQGGAINARFICKCIFFNHQILFTVWRFMYFMYFVQKRQKIDMWVLLYVFDHLQSISMWMGLSLVVWMQFHKLCNS